jgi:hypothetical protein
MVGVTLIRSYQSLSIKKVSFDVGIEDGSPYEGLFALSDSDSDSIQGTRRLTI